VVSPVARRGLQWFAFEDPISAAAKSSYANQQNLGGVFVWSLDMDDYG